VTGLDRRDERRHPPGDERLWNESWYFDFVSLVDGQPVGGWVRLGLYPNLDRSWYTAFLARPGRPLVAVVDLDAPMPRSSQGLDVRSDGLWCDHVCETPFDHWSVANEAFGVAVDDPGELYGRGLGERVAVGFDLEWEDDGEAYPYPGVTRYEVPCRVHGEVLVGDERIAIDGFGQRDHSWGVRDWWLFDWCWTAGRLDDGTRFHASDIRIPNVELGFGYLQPPLVAATGARSRETRGDHGFPTEGRMEIVTGAAVLDLAIEPLAFAPVLLVDDDGRTSRFPRALCGFTAADGRTGHGWTEWNQVVPTSL
jgi:hypothetical protein